MTEEVTALQDAAARLVAQVERLQEVEASVGQLQNVLEVVHSELEAGHKTSHVSHGLVLPCLLLRVFLYSLFGFVLQGSGCRRRWSACMNCIAHS